MEEGLWGIPQLQGRNSSFSFLPGGVGSHRRWVGESIKQVAGKRGQAGSSKVQTAPSSIGGCMTVYSSSRIMLGEHSQTTRNWEGSETTFLGGEGTEGRQVVVIRFTPHTRTRNGGKGNQ